MPWFMISIPPHGWNDAARLEPHVPDVDAVVHLSCLMSVMKLDYAMLYDFLSPPWLELCSASGAACLRCRRSCASQMSHVCHEVGRKENKSFHAVDMYIYIHTNIITTSKPLQWLHLPDDLNPYLASTYIYIYVDMCIYIHTYIITTYKPLQWLHLPDDLNPYLGSKSIYIYVYIVIYVEMCLYINTYTYISDYII